MTDRHILPQRRSTFTLDMRDDSGRVDLTVAYSTFEPPGAPPPHTVAEIFVTARKIGSSMEAIARDAAILLSLALQYGCPIDTIRHALTRNQDGSAQSLMGRVVDRVTTEAQQQ
jgi:hypothetical protein